MSGQGDTQHFATPPGWYPDPHQPGQLRWWDGSTWTSHAAPGGPRPAGYVSQPTTPYPVGGGPGVLQPHLQVDPAKVGWCRALVIGGAALALVGSFLPWASVDTILGTISVNGTSGDGVLTAIGALLVGGLAGQSLWSKVVRGLVIAAVVVSALVTAVAFVDVVDVTSRVGDANTTGLVHATVGIGLWITVLGGIAAIVGTALTLASIRRPHR